MPDFVRSAPAAREHGRTGGLHRHGAQMGIKRFQIAGRARERAARAHAGHQRRDIPDLPGQFRAGGFKVRLWVEWVIKLPGQNRAGDFAQQGLRAVDRALHARFPGREHDFAGHRRG